MTEFIAVSNLYICKKNHFLELFLAYFNLTSLANI